MAAEPLGPFLDIDHVLGKAKNRINLVGVELEGGWKKLPKGNLVPVRDGSINFACRTDPVEIVELLTHIGEIPLPPLGVKEFPPILKLYYPTYVNATCGMHVHLSTMKTFAYQRLMTNAPFSYPGTIVEYMKRWATAQKLDAKHPIWHRLAGRNEYCQHVFQAEEQVTKASKDFDHHRSGHRYTVVGFCWSRLKTLECRLLPMMDTAEKAVSAVQEIINITNAFLAASRERELKLRSKVIDSEDIEIEERHNYV
jgi:hypothetical protein